ncbi:MAG: o-succinylbenzoate synthase [Alphaproteobacteria bacterium]|nr:o-succinylbenzoate synthase [Alphaproteobacteria bacterium]
MSLDIIRIELFVVELPLVQPFTISVGSVHSRKLVLVKMIDRQGVVGWGEATPLEEPIYKPDYFGSVLAVLEQILAPAVLRHGIYDTPEELDDSLAFVRGHYFAKAALSIAAYDIAAQKKNQNLAAYLGATKTEIALSHTIPITKSPQEMLDEAAKAADEGYTDIKLKIAPRADLSFASALRHQYPDLPLMVDANAAYHYNDETLRLFRAFDDLNFFCIEQPLEWNDLYDHACLQKQLKTPIALDESVDCVHDFEQALALQSCRLLNIKISRVGGLTAAKRLYDLGCKNKIGLWVGGMIEGPIGLASVIAFSVLSGLDYPADFIDSHYLIRGFSDYFNDAPYTLNNGKLTPNFSKQGLGLAINYSRLCQYAQPRITLTA